MNALPYLSRVLIVVGAIGMLAGAMDPLEGSLIILPGTGLAAFGAFLGKSQYRLILYWSLILVAVGVGDLFALSALGGIGGSAALAMWWGLLILPYPVGWILGLAGIALELIEVFRPPALPREEVH